MGWSWDPNWRAGPGSCFLLGMFRAIGMAAGFPFGDVEAKLGRSVCVFEPGASELLCSVLTVGLRWKGEYSRSRQGSPVPAL